MHTLQLHSYSQTLRLTRTPTSCALFCGQLLQLLIPRFKVEDQQTRSFLGALADFEIPCTVTSLSTISSFFTNIRPSTPHHLRTLFCLRGNTASGRHSLHSSTIHLPLLVTTFITHRTNVQHQHLPTLLIASQSPPLLFFTRHTTPASFPSTALLYVIDKIEKNYFQNPRLTYP